MHHSLQPQLWQSLRCSIVAKPKAPMPIFVAALRHAQVENAYKIGTKYDWLHILPGHGRPGRFADTEARLRAINALARHYNFEPSSA